MILPYIHFTEEQKLRAASVNLEEFLRARGETLIRSGLDKRLASNHSVTVRANEWYDHAAEEGGGPISFVRTFYNMSYPEAVSFLLTGEMGAWGALSDIYPAVNRRPARRRKPFALPPANSDMRRVFAYLLQKRFIDRDVLTAFVREKRIYESREPSKDGTKTYHNAVFVGYDEHGVPRHAHKRGLYTEGKAFKGNVEGGDPAYSFHHDGAGDSLYVFEAPVDMLSFITLHPQNWREHSYAALCGVSEHALLKRLELNPGIRRIILCLDYDAAGIEAAGRLEGLLREKGYTQTKQLLPEHKDWNESLKAEHGLKAQPAEEHPQTAAAEKLCARLSATAAALPQSAKPEDRLPALSQNYRRELRLGREDAACTVLEDMAALSLFAATREYRQLGEAASPDALAEQLRASFRPHENRSALLSRSHDITTALATALELSGADGLRSEARKEEQAEAFMNLALVCAKAVIRHEADELKQTREQENRYEPAIRME
jgi:hypothetical protein